MPRAHVCPEFPGREMPEPIDKGNGHCKAEEVGIAIVLVWGSSYAVELDLLWREDVCIRVNRHTV